MTELRIVITNTSGQGGTFLTPFWFGFHDNSFDLFNSGEAASAGLEGLAEDGNPAGLDTELTMADADGQGFFITGEAGPIVAGETTSQIVEVDGASNTYVDLAAMLLPSNDAFVGTGNSVRLFKEDGDFIRARTLTFSGDNVYDAGTEVNTELDAAFINQMAPNTGVDENGVVRLHDGFNGSAGNPEGEGDQIILGGVNAFGADIDPAVADFTLPGAEIASVHINEVARHEGDDEDNTIIGSRKDDIVDAGDGDDVVSGGRGFDVVSGGEGDDEIRGGRGNDELYGDEGEDDIRGGRGDDAVMGGEGDDDIRGGRGNDHLSGGADDDDIRGGRGDDHIAGDTGDDYLLGGRGADVFYFKDGDGEDIIGDFGRGDDQIFIESEFIASFQDVLDNAEEIDGDVEIAVGDDILVLEDTSVNDLTASDFLFG